MSALDFLVRASTSYGAGRALQESVHALLRAGHNDAAVMLTDLFTQIRDTAAREAQQDAACFVKGAEQDVIANRTEVTS